MFNKIKNRVERELSCYIQSTDKLYSLNTISPILFKSIKDFISRQGKRIRPILFVLGYLGFAKKAAPGLYRSAVSIELMHDFMLVHDDIIDKSDTRRGQPSMHKMLNQYLAGRKNLKFNGQDLAIVVGDVLYAMALDSFLAIKEDGPSKERALRKLIAAALYTGSGEFIELISGLKNIDRISKKNIYKIYDLKTANYTFASPLAIGASLAGAQKIEVNRLFHYGLYLGRAFQIKDDIMGIFSDESEIGKSNLTDLNEGKKTLLIWQAYQNAGYKDRLTIKKILAKGKVNEGDLLKIRRIITQCGALEEVKKEVAGLIRKADDSLKASKMNPGYKNSLRKYAQELLRL